MLRLYSDYAIENELKEIVNLFYGTSNIDISIECAFFGEPPYITVNDNFYHIEAGNKNDKKFTRQCKLALYNALSAYTGKSFPWGALTGVRPTKLGYEIAASGNDIVGGLMDYKVSLNKAELVKNVISNQNGLAYSTKKINFYVHIPFCTSRCNYCSFVSLPVDRNQKLMEEYTKYLIEEIKVGVETLKKGDYEVDSVYIGGGTPTALNEEQLKAVLEAIPYKNIEYTVEAGRPDTITKQKLDIMSQNGVTRISINPQSFVDKTLKAIGRAHTAQDIKDIYNIAKGKFIINMDLIAGLSDETIDDFNYTLKEVVASRPENITVHTLARKNGSIIKTENIAATQGSSQMVDAALEVLTKNGYRPYYLYRQKNMTENLENIGYALPGTECVNNITTMEEFYSVFACGAGAISKRLLIGNRIERHANLRDVRLYIEQFKDRLDKKTKFFL